MDEDERLPKSARLRKSDAERLFERTGGVPLAMVWSIAQMGFGYGVEAVLHRLGQPTSDISRFCFEGAVERISGKPAHKLLMVLSLCAESANRESLGYATELAEFDRDDGLVELEKLSLVNKSGDRFWLLPLTKQYASAEFETSAEKEQLRGKWIEYFSQLCQKYASKYWNWTNYEWLIAEGDNILAIIDWTITKNFGEITLLFTRSIERYLDIQGRWSEIVDYGERLHTVAYSLNDKSTWAWISVHWLGWFYVEQGKIERAALLTEQAQSLYKDLDDFNGLCLAMTHQARVLRRAKKYEDVEKICKQAMNIAQQYDYGDGIANIHEELGKLYRDRKQWTKAKFHFQAAIEWCEEHQDKANLDITFLLVAIGNLGWVEFNLGNSHYGKELIERSLLQLEHIGGKGYKTALRWRLAIIEKVLGNREKALQHAQEAYLWAERLGMARELEGAKALLRELNAENPSTQGTE